MKKLWPALILAICLGVLAIPKSAAANVTCLKDPDYPAAGSYSLPNSQSAECPSGTVYSYTGSGGGFAIVYSTKSQSGTITQVGTFKIVDPKADPLVFRGPTTYGMTSEIRVPRTNFGAGERYTGFIAPVGVSINITDAGKNFANAQGISYAGASAGCPELGTPGLKDQINCSSGNPIFSLLQFILNWAVRLLYALAVLAIVVAGIQYIVSQGNPEGLKQAKSRLSHAIIGLILLTLTFVILRVLGVT